MRAEADAARLAQSAATATRAIEMFFMAGFYPVVGFCGDCGLAIHELLPGWSLDSPATSSTTTLPAARPRAGHGRFHSGFGHFGVVPPFARNAGRHACHTRTVHGEPLVADAIAHHAAQHRVCLLDRMQRRPTIVLGLRDHKGETIETVSTPWIVVAKFAGFV